MHFPLLQVLISCKAIERQFQGGQACLPGYSLNAIKVMSELFQSCVYFQGPVISWTNLGVWQVQTYSLMRSPVIGHEWWEKE